MIESFSVLSCELLYELTKQALFDMEPNLALKCLENIHFKSNPLEVISEGKGPVIYRKSISIMFEYERNTLSLQKEITTNGELFLNICLTE